MDRLREACGNDFSRVLFLDETGALTNATRTHGRCEQRRRCVDRVPGGHWHTMTAVAAIRLEGLTAAATTPHATDCERFIGHVGHAWLPAVRERIEAVGARVMHLPPYSPASS